MMPRLSITIRLVMCPLTMLLMSCARPSPAPPAVLSSWSEQLAALQQAIKDTNGDFVIFSGSAYPEAIKPGVATEPVELNVFLVFTNPKAARTGEDGVKSYPTRVVHFNDYRLASSLRAEEEYLSRASADDMTDDPKFQEATRSIRLSAQDALKLTRAEGEKFMGEPVYRGNITISLWLASQVPPELNAAAVWVFTYQRRDKSLSLLVNAQTGDILKRNVTEKKLETK